MEVGTDESMALVAGLVIGGLLWYRWLRPMMILPRVAGGRRLTTFTALVPVLCIVLLVALLQIFADADVRGSYFYTAMYTAVGITFLGMSIHGMRFVGYSARDDVAERRNPAAALAITGGFIGFTLAFTGANFGDGPGWWVVLYCAGLSCGALLILWAAVETITQIGDRINIDRHMASGLRLGAFVVAGGLIFGRAVAGDYIDLDDALFDFLGKAWPVIFLFAIEIAVARSLRLVTYDPQEHLAIGGIVPAIGYLAFALIYVIWLGWW